MIYKGKNYHSKKHPVLEYIFKKYFKSIKEQKIIPFYLSDISEGYDFCGIDEPVSISNTILDLCRQDRGISSRVPESISSLGYDLRKKTGANKNGKNFAGEFVFVGVGNGINSWLKWPDVIKEIKIDSSPLPDLVRKLIRTDEGGLFSVIDYCNVFSNALYEGEMTVYRIQNPMKWQPNEIDGFYASGTSNDVKFYPIEAKSLATGDAINLDQMSGAYETILSKLRQFEIKASIQQVAVKMIKNGIDIAIFPVNTSPIKPERFLRVIFDPPIENWQ